MSLIDEITDFLTDCHLLHETAETDGIRTISVSTGNGRTRQVFPLDVDASDIGEAVRKSSEAQKQASYLTENNGEYPLIIMEDRWRSQGAMMQKRLLAHLETFAQIYARNCEVRKIDKLTAAEFLKANHSYGDAACRYRYGLYLKRHTGHNAGLVDIPAGSLVAVATFSNARKWTKGEKTIRSYEWTRYASLPGVRLSGGMGKLLKAFIQDVKPDDIMTYSDLEWSEGGVYEQLGFTLEGQKSPVTFRVGADWERTPVRSETEEGGCLYLRNFGSNKYRLKLTDYQ